MSKGRFGYATIAIASLFGVFSACSLTVPDVGGGVGDACEAASDCQGAEADCVDGRCILACKTDDDCPQGSKCGEQICDVSFKVGFVYDGNATVSGFSRAHDEGRLAAKESLPWVDFSLVAQDIQKDQESEAVTNLIADGASTIFVTTSRFGNVAAELAATNPEVKFLTFGVSQWEGNFAGYVPRYHQAWYLAGVAFGSFAKSRDASDPNRFHFGFVGALPIPEVIRQLNAFTLGVRSVEASATVDVVWLAGFVPATGLEEKALDYLIEDGARFIINRIGARNTDLMVAIDAYNAENPGNEVYGSLLDNADACEGHETYCLGGPTWNWGPLYTRIVSEIQRGTFDSTVQIRDSILADPSKSVVNLTLGLQPEFSGPLRDALDSAIQRLTSGGDNTFSPNGGNEVCPTDTAQRPEGCVKGRVDDAELDSMCWLVEGVVQREDPNAPFDEMDNGLVVAKTPTGETWPPASFGDTPVPLGCN